jgi:hypothetical protein
MTSAAWAVISHTDPHAARALARMRQGGIKQALAERDDPGAEGGR